MGGEWMIGGGLGKFIGIWSCHVHKTQCNVFFFFQAEDGIRDGRVTGVQTCALPICTIIGTAGIFGLVFGSAKAQTDGWGSAVTLTSLIAGAVLLVGFVVLQKVDRSPLVPLRVLADRNRGAAYLTLVLGQAGVFVLFLFLTYYFQGVLGYSPIKTGVAFLPMMVTVVI